MAYRSLRDFIVALEAQGELVRVSEPVSTVLEMTEICTRLLASGGPAVLFEHPVNADGTRGAMPCLVNLFGTVRRVAMAVTLGDKARTTAADLREVGELMAFLRSPEPPRDMKEAWDMLPLARTVMGMRPKTVSHAPVAGGGVHRQGDRSGWPADPDLLARRAGAAHNLAPGGHQGPSETREDDFNLGIYRLQVIGRDRTIMRWLAHRGGAQHYRRWKEAGKPAALPACAVLGADPGTILAAVTPVPDTLSEYQFAGLLRGAKVELVPAKTQPLLVPAQAEIVIEGEVRLDELADEGPYGDHTGYYNGVERFPVFQVTAITMRRDPIYLTTHTGRPPDEPSVLGEALNEVFIPLFQAQFPEIVDFWLPPEGCSYRIAVVSMKKAYPGHAKRVMMGVWSYLRQFMYTKWVIVVDDDIDARDWKDVMWALSTRMDPARDITLIENTPIDYLDFASPESGLGSKIGLDATNKWPPETKRAWGRKIEMDSAVVDKVSEMWGRIGLPGDGRPVWK